MTAHLTQGRKIPASSAECREGLSLLIEPVFVFSGGPGR